MRVDKSKIMNQYKGKIGKKLSLYMVLLVIIPVAFVGYFTFNYVQDELVDNAVRELQNETESHGKALELELGRFGNNVRFLAHTPPIQGLIRAKKNKGVDPMGNVSYGEWQDRLGIIFEEISRSYGEYLQVRYLDENGQEIVRVDSDGVNIVRKPEDKLQNKADRYYFTDTMMLSEGEMFISPLDLNREGSPPEVEVPYKPVIRYGVPVFDEETNERKGIVILNVGAKGFLSSFNNEDNKKMKYVVDQDGYYFVNSDRSREWGGPRDLGTGHNVKNDFRGEMSSLILSGEEGSVDMPEHDHVLAYYPIYFDQGDGDNFWVAFNVVSREEVLRPIILMRDIIFGLALSVGFVAMIFSFFFSRSISVPLRKLTEMAKLLSEGKWESKIEINRNDEIGILAESFNKMADEIVESKSDLEKKIEERTRELNENKERLEDQQKAVLNILEDIDEDRMKAEVVAGDLKKFQLAVDDASDHIVITDADGILLYANKAVERITGFSKEEIIGQKAGSKDNWGGLMEAKVYKNLWKTLKKDKKPYIGELKNMRKNGEEYIAEARVSPILNDKKEVLFFVGIERDVTKEKEVDRMKTEFISLASHQLRTPLSAMKWFLEMLLGGDMGKLTKEQQEAIENVNTSNERMIDLVNALLNISRIESGRIIIDPKPTNIKELVENTVKELEPKIKEKKMDVIVSVHGDLPKIKLDPNLIGEVYKNLLTNAVKYTPKGGEIEVMVSKKENELISKISDNGMGIPKEEQKKVFGKFFRGDNVVKLETDGTGLGLYLVKSIIDASKGRVWFKSEENKGTTFWFSLPMSGMKAKKGEVSINH